MIALLWPGYCVCPESKASLEATTLMEDLYILFWMLSDKFKLTKGKNMSNFVLILLYHLPINMRVLNFHS